MQFVHGVFPKTWLVAAYGPDVEHKPLAHRICDKPVVLFRTASGKAAALERTAAVIAQCRCRWVNAKQKVSAVPTTAWNSIPPAPA